MNVVWGEREQALYVTLMAVGQIRAFSVQGEPKGMVPVGANPAQLVLRNGVLVTANRGDASASVVVTNPVLAEVRRVPLPGAEHPHGVAFGPAGHIVYIAYEGTVGTRGGVVAVDLQSGTELWRTELGSYVLGIAWGPGPR